MDRTRLIKKALATRTSISRQYWNPGPLQRYSIGAIMRHPESAYNGAIAGAVGRDVAPGALFGGASAALLALALGSKNWGKWGLAGAAAGGLANGLYNS